MHFIHTKCNSNLFSSSLHNSEYFPGLQSINPSTTRLEDNILFHLFFFFLSEHNEGDICVL